MMFEKRELAVIDALASGEKLSDSQKENVLPDLKEKLGASTQEEVVERFVAVTGWTNAPKDYPQ